MVSLRVANFKAYYDYLSHFLKDKAKVTLEDTKIEIRWDSNDNLMDCKLCLKDTVVHCVFFKGHEKKQSMNIPCEEFIDFEKVTKRLFPSLSINPPNYAVPITKYVCQANASEMVLCQNYKSKDDGCYFCEQGFCTAFQS